MLIKKNVSSTCFESDLILWARTVRLFSKILFLLIAKNKSFCFKCSNLNNASSFI